MANSDGAGHDLWLFVIVFRKVAEVRGSFLSLFFGFGYWGLYGLQGGRSEVLLSKANRVCAWV